MQVVNTLKQKKLGKKHMISNKKALRFIPYL